ncbi:hypothetical protein AALO_G00050580 [Alosa alosa]|uniref:PH domain-containing protein n=1 Tax=Alosa alosa TaxID=278164 RepID=A0AAV6H981_9TELE|nr:uncharacterized protein LOC125293900 [Alosa alosa]KAG5281951.1 hypothetical protein AALO_G00050580 [Alosa alosa]
MGCCSVTQRHTGIDDVGPDEIELLEIDGTGVWNLGESRQSVRNGTGPPPPPVRCPSVRQLTQEEPKSVETRISCNDVQIHHDIQTVLWGWSKEEVHHRIYTQPIREWEGRAAHSYGDIIYSSLVTLHNTHTKAMGERYLVLFSFHLLILALDHSHHNFIYEGILPLSALEVRIISQDPSAPYMFEISGPMMDSKIFICASGTDRKNWMDNIEDRRYKSLRQQLSPSHSALAYLLPCDEMWKREELKRYLLRAPIWQWEGTSIQHMGLPVFLSLVHVTNSQKQVPQERLLVLFPRDILILSVDSQRVCVKYEGRLPRRSIQALERSALPGNQFELSGELMEPLQVSCTYPEDYQTWIFQLQQPDKEIHTSQISNHSAPPPLIPKKRRS